jgi:quinoprotein glucose dehydrogenase
VRSSLIPFVALISLGAAQVAEVEPYRPHVEPASDEARQALASFKIPDGFQVELYAAEPMFANPVCFWPDTNGRFYVAESFRLHQGVTDIREHMDWLDDDLACKTVADRVAMYQKHLGDRFPEFTRAYERVSLLRDTDGDGFADSSTVFADGFNAAADGIGAGLLEHEGDVYFTCIPSLWRLHDDDGDGRAEQKTVLTTGYGVRVAFLGHDMHGLRIGPDGLLYFSIGDRGFHIETENGLVSNPDTGAVFRCNLDGSGLEVFATGLRNPQELVFNEWGDLFTGDNNSDSGDRARFVHVIEGGDSGWRQPYQWIQEPTLRGPWNEDQLWVPHFDGQAAYIVPPIANLADGPSGLTINPGTGLPPRYDRHFFLCDFRGTRDSGIHTFTLENRGASFALGPVERFVWGSLVTDCEFGPDGALYFSDWVEGWNQTGKGRLYRVFDPVTRATDIVRETRGALADGVSGSSIDSLIALLSHPDQRVRQAAQFELVAQARRKPDGYAILTRVAGHSESVLARVHAIWAVGMYFKDAGPIALSLLAPMLEDPSAEVRAQAARTIGDLADTRALAPLVARLADESPRVRMFAAISVGKLGKYGATLAIDPLKTLIKEIGQSDPVLRHAAVMGLVGCADESALADCSHDASEDVRIAAVVALRRIQSTELTRFLTDASPRVAAEAARAIYDVPVPDALPALADLVRSTRSTERALVRRAVHASFRLGGEQRARELAQFALTGAADESLRAEALQRLAEWAQPSSRDPVVGAWWPLEPRPVAFLPDIVRSLDRAHIEKSGEPLVQAWIRLVEVYGVADQTPLLATWVRDAARPSAVRCAALRALKSLGAAELAACVREVLSDRDGALRAVAVGAIGLLPAGESLPLLDRIADQGELAERRAAFEVLAKIDGEVSEGIFLREVNKYARRQIPEEVMLDLWTAIRTRPSFESLVDLHNRIYQDIDPALAPYQYSLLGGDAEAGKKIFRTKAELSCLRCHAVESEHEQAGGGRVGPSLVGIGKRLGRLALLEAIVTPNRRMAPGYQTSVIALNEGGYVDGRVVAEDAQCVRMLNAAGEIVEVQAADIETRRDGLSAMPEGQSQFLSPREMRDLIEYLSEL